VRIVIADRQPVRVVWLRYTGPLGEPLGRFWRTTVGPWLAEHGLLDCPRYGVTLDNPLVTPAEECRYDACVELPRGLEVPDAAEAMISGGLYAMTHFTGTSAGIGAAWRAFFEAALGDAPQRIDAARHPFEHYPRGTLFDARTGQFACELCLPLRR
jgi:AraC family transcriptional regulator